MRLFDFLRLLDPAVTPEHTKLHLATGNGEDHPLDVYLGGWFDEWQRWQSRRNFERPRVLSLIQLPAPGQWLFAGVYASLGHAWHDERAMYAYEMEELTSCREMSGRLVARFERPGRQSYLNAETWAEALLLDHVRAERLTIADFPGFRAVDLSKEQLDIVTSQALDSWKAALSSVAGVYLISDAGSGKRYVGSACGEGGIWQRWCDYAATGHGGNVELVRLLAAEGLQRAWQFRFSILEIADIHDSQESILARESHWKSVLMTRRFGLNAN